MAEDEKIDAEVIKRGVLSDRTVGDTTTLSIQIFSNDDRSRDQCVSSH